jgi:hypothetical protein
MRANKNPPAVEMPGGSYDWCAQSRLHTKTSRKTQASASEAVTPKHTRHLPDLEKPVSGASQGAGSDSVTADRGAALRYVHTATYAHGTHSFRQRGSVPGSQTLRQQT